MGSRGARVARSVEGAGGMRRGRRNQRLIALACLGWLLFNYPLLSLFNGGGALLGVPVLYAYLFATWAALIGVLALIAERGQ